MVFKKKVEEPKQETQTEEKEEERYGLGELTIQKDIVLFDSETNEQITDREALVLVLNKLDKLEKLIVG